MHSMPPLVTISSSGAGPAALGLLLAVGQVLADARDPLDRRVLQRHAGLVAQQPLDDVVEHGGRERLRVGEAAHRRQHAGRRAGQDRVELGAAAARVRLAKVKLIRRPRTPARSPRRASRRSTCAAWLVMSCSGVPAAIPASIARSARPIALAGLQRRLDLRGGRDHDAVVVGEHDVAGGHVERRRRGPAAAAARARRWSRRPGSCRARTRAARARAGRRRRGSARRSRRRPGRGGAPRWRTARRAPARRAAVGGDHQHLAGLAPRRAR